MKYSLCIGAYQGKDVIYHLEKIKQLGFHGLEVYNWWDLDLKQVAMAQEQIGIGINATCTRSFNLVDPDFRNEYIKGLEDTIEACKVLVLNRLSPKPVTLLKGWIVNPNKTP